VGGFGEIIFTSHSKRKIDLDFLWLDDKRKIRVVVAYSFVSLGKKRKPTPKLYDYKRCEKLRS
jgi:hypothetical protein